jgi:hypothetical protein
LVLANGQQDSRNKNNFTSVICGSGQLVKTALSHTSSNTAQALEHFSNLRETAFNIDPWSLAEYDPDTIDVDRVPARLEEPDALDVMEEERRVTPSEWREEDAKLPGSPSSPPLTVEFPLAVSRLDESCWSLLRNLRVAQVQ